VNPTVVRDQAVNGVVASQEAVPGVVGRETVAGSGVHGVRGRLSWLALGVALAAALGLYAPVMAGMPKEWSEFPSLSHGFAVPLISAYLLWRRRQLLADAPFEGSTVGLPFILVALSMLAVGSLAGEPFVARLSLPLVLFGTVLFLGGPQIARHAWVGIAYLVFMIPLPYLTLKALTYHSRLFDAGVTATVLGWLGVPVLRDGVMLHLANMTLEVADDCSSVPAIAALLALGAAYAQMQPRPTWIRATLTLGAVPLGLLSNIFRITVTALGVHYIGPIAIQNIVHHFGGTTVFLLTVVLLVSIDALLMRLWKRTSS
jgi:exosortase